MRFEMPVDPDVKATRAWRIKYGFCANVEQEITKDLGLWARLGWDDGHTETWAFTPIDDSFAVGLLLKGTRWHRPQDEVGAAFIIDGIMTGRLPWSLVLLGAFLAIVMQLCGVSALAFAVVLGVCNPSSGSAWIARRNAVNSSSIASPALAQMFI